MIRTLAVCYSLGDEKNPEAFGVAKFDNDGNIIDIIEKPERPSLKHCHWWNLPV